MVVLYAIAGILVLVGMLVVERYTKRRVRAGPGRYVWFSSPFMVGLPFVWLWLAIVVFPVERLLAVLFAVVGVLLLGLTLRTFHRLSRAVSSTPPDGDLGAAIQGPLWDHVATYFAAFMLGAFLFAVGLIMWGVIRAAR